VFEQRQQRALAVVEGDEVEVVEDARLAELAQLGVHEAAAEHRDDCRVGRLDGLGDAEGGIHRARKRHRQQHHLGLVAGQGFQRRRRRVSSTSVGGAARARARGSKVGWAIARDSA